jgi:hypothetical protein
MRCFAAPVLALATAFGALPATAVAAQGDLLVTNLRQVIRADGTTGARTMVSSNTSPGQGVDFNMGDTIGLAMGPDGDVFVADAGWFDSPNPFQLPASGFGDTGGVWRIDTATGVRTVVSSNATHDGDADFDSPVGVAFEADGNLIVSDYDANGNGEHVFRIDPDVGYRTLLSSNASPSTDGESYQSVEGLAITPGGTIYMADSNAHGGGGGVFRVNPVTGERTMISNNASPGVGAVPDFENPSAVAVDGNGDLLVADRQDQSDFVGAVIRVDPVTGERSLVSATGNPAQDFHEDLVNPAGIAVAADDGILVTRDPFNHEFGGVERVDPVTGARSLVSIFDGPQGGADLLGPWGILVDSTPTIQTTFLSADVPAAGPARLRLKVSGLRYALTGRDWSLTNALPAGLAIAPNPNATLACEDFAGAASSPSGIGVTAAAGAAAIDLVGHLDRGEAFCAIDVDVVAPGGPDKYVTNPADVTARVGIDPPSSATSAVRFHAPPFVTIESPANGQTVDRGVPLAASFACLASAGVRSCTGTSANGASLDTSVAGTFAYSATVVDAVGQVATKTVRYTVKAPATPSPPLPPVREPRTGAQLALACSGAQIALLEVVQVGNRVRFKGVTARANAGRQVPIRLIGGERVVLARVGTNGIFEITGPLPKRSIRETERARYVAELGRERSPSVKLTRRMTMDALNLARATVTIYGQVTKPLPKVKRNIVITERTSCSGKAKVVATVRPNAKGNYRATFRRPRDVDSAIYRLRTRVRVEGPGRKETFRTYTLVRVVDLF